MPPRVNSRHTFSGGIRNEVGQLLLEDPKIFAYRDLIDNRIHSVQRGDTLYTLASRYFKGLERAAGYWWLIAWFQPDPLHDPTIELVPGTRLVIPSLATLKTLVFNRSREEE